MFMEVGQLGPCRGDTLDLETGSPGTPHGTNPDLRIADLGKYIDLTEEQNVITWQTDREGSGHGWTLMFQPNYPELLIPLGTPMVRGASGYRVVPVLHGAATVYPTSLDAASEWGGSHADPSAPGDASREADVYVETLDWLIPNTTCTPTTMHCPLPHIWAHINYTTPSLYPEPAEGSCLQQKTGTSDLVGCSDKMNAEIPMPEQLWHETGNGLGVNLDTSYSEKFPNWAGNCGDSTSYFWFEKIACGATRTFYTDRSLIEDFVQLTPTWEDIQQILDLFYTTKAPQFSPDANLNPVGFQVAWVTGDYHIPPVLPPLEVAPAECGVLPGSTGGM